MSRICFRLNILSVSKLNFSSTLVYNQVTHPGPSYQPFHCCSAAGQVRVQSSQRRLAEMCFEIASFPSVARLNEIPAPLQSPLIYVSSDSTQTLVWLWLCNVHTSMFMMCLVSHNHLGLSVFYLHNTTTSMSLNQFKDLHSPLSHQ